MIGILVTCKVPSMSPKLAPLCNHRNPMGFSAVTLPQVTEAVTTAL